MDVPPRTLATPADLPRVRPRGARVGAMGQQKKNTLGAFKERTCVSAFLFN